MAVETLTGNINAREARKITGIPGSSIRRILHAMVDLYPYVLQILHQLLHADTDKRLNFAKWALVQMDRGPQWFLNVMFSDEACFHSMLTSVLKTVVSVRHQTLVSATSSHCIHLMWLFGVVSLRLTWWVLSFLKSLALNLAEKVVKSLKNDILHFAWSRCTWIAEGDMRYLSLLSCRIMYHSISTWSQDVPVEHFHRRPNDKSRL